MRLKLIKILTILMVTAQLLSVKGQGGQFIHYDYQYRTSECAT